MFTAKTFQGSTNSAPHKTLVAVRDTLMLKGLRGIVAASAGHLHIPGELWTSRNKKSATITPKTATGAKVKLIQNSLRSLLREWHSML